MKAVLLGILIGIPTGLIWQWSLLRTVELVLKSSGPSSRRVAGWMMLRLCAIGTILWLLLVTKGVRCLLTALLMMLAARDIAGVLSLKRIRG